MKHIALIAVIVTDLLTLSSSAAAQETGCPEGGPLEVYGTALGSHGGYSGDALVGACLNTDTAFDGGYAEVGPSGAIVNGSDDNAGTPGGYYGYHAAPVADSSKDSNCDGNDSASVSRNSGGCLWLAATNTSMTNALTTRLYCDSRRGADPNASTRDGCTIL